MDALEGLRLARVRPFLVGRLLDVGCGYNNLARDWPGAVGVDIHAWPGVGVLADAAALPFKPRSFDTVSVLAALNHFPDRAGALRQIHAVLRPGGRLVLTMIGPLTGRLAHLVFRHDLDHRDEGAEGETPGLAHREVRALLAAAGYALVTVRRFELGLNRVYVARRG